MTPGETVSWRGARLSIDGRRVRAVLFDVDGTLVDSIPFLVDCFRHAARHALAVELEERDVLPLVGMPLVEMFRHVDPACHDEAVQRCVDAYREAYYPSVATRSPIFPDAVGVVDELKELGLALGVVSGKNAEGIRRILEPSGLFDRFDAVVGADHPGRGKPAPDHALAAAELLGVAAAEAVVVGDSLLDVEMGHAAGMATVGVTTGTTPRPELEVRAHAVVDALVELRDLFAPSG